MNTRPQTKPVLALKTKQGELTLPLTRALWLVYRVASYPTVIALTLYLYGTEASVFAVAALILTYRGNL